jgi:hypothetical protein
MIAAVVLAGPDSKRTKDPAAKPKAAQQQITGCLDQRGEAYVLKSEKDMSAVTTVRGKALSDDNFARYVGHTVSVSGTKDGDLFWVTKIVNIADSCSR